MGVCQDVISDNNTENFFRCLSSDDNKIQETNLKRTTEATTTDRENEINNKLKSSVFANFKRFTPNQQHISKRKQLLEKSHQSQQSDIVFETFSIDNTNLNNVTIDYYQLSRTIFDSLNKLRQTPSLIVNYVKNSKEYNKGDIILWNEKVYLCASNYLIDVEDNCNNKINSTASERISKRLNGKYICWEYNVNGLNTPNSIISTLLNDNMNSIDSILTKSFYAGAVCCFPAKEFKMRTLIYFVNKI